MRYENRIDMIIVQEHNNTITLIIKKDQDFALAAKVLASFSNPLISSTINQKISHPIHHN